MKRFWIFFCTLFVCITLTISAIATEASGVGEVLYHQDFSVLSDIGKSGIVRGTSSSDSAVITCTDDSLELNTFDNDRLYAVLPYRTSTDSPDSYTVEFEFSFSEIASENGYIGFLLTCRGTEPTNITALVIRADGTIDNFAEPNEEMKKAICDGKTVCVKIPIEKNVFHKVELTCGDTTCTLERENVKVLEDGGCGFAVRNASVNVGEIYIVSGTGYTEKSGVYAKKSYAEDEAVLVTDTLEASVEASPETGESAVPYVVCATVAAVGLLHRRPNHVK